ncbi:hypothetical protein FOJ82_00480 [Tessaracoccus rhinocerotis]|uniref:Uncharacterized protein n=1 Tax=Tessaracoccus rhinocerotis TaxID=1689449 RepID=A0A553K414_9ACTN|nr:hypothetical protein [Tessaracoccus rhinocerotis]TRY19428.1 hypothetical protein FOJ82_00480 [Tessaracoccus rhinocerotis]
MLFGRDAFLEAIHASTSGLHVIHGDSGVGKSAVLRSLSAQSVVPTVYQYSGSLLNTLVRATGDVISSTPRRHLAVRLGPAIRDLLAKATGVTFGQTLRFFTRALSSVVKAQSGVALGEIVEAAGASAADALEDAIADNLSEASQPDAPLAFAELAKSVVNAMGEFHVVLDSGPKLSPRDLEVLEALPVLLPPGAKVTIAMAVTNSDATDAISSLGLCGAVLHELLPLAPQDVADWIRESNVRVPNLTQFLRSTGGFPLMIEGALRHLEEGGELKDLTPTETLESEVERTWRPLSREAKRTARRLAHFAFPLPRAASIVASGLSGEDFDLVRIELEEARLLVKQHDGQVWFHDRKRQAVQNACGAGLASSARATVEALWNQADLLSYEHCLDYAMAAACAHDDGLLADAAQIIGLPRETLACLMAVIELAEPQEDGPGFVPLLNVLRWASLYLDSKIPARSALELARDSGLVVIGTHESYSVVALTIRIPGMFALLLGLCEQAFGRMPWQSIASQIVRGILAPRLYGHQAIRYGVCAAGTTGLPDEYDASWYALDPLPWTITTRLRLAQHRVFAHASFPTRESRDEAVMDLTTLPPRFDDAELVVEYVLKTPAPVIRERRFVRAWQLASKSSIGYLDRVHTLPMGPTPLEELAEMQQAARTVIRERLNLTERLATSLYDEMSLGFAHLTGGGVLTAEFTSSEPQAIPLVVPASIDVWARHWDYLELAKENGLPMEAEFGYVTVESALSTAPEHPTTAIIKRFTDSAYRFNRDYGEEVSFSTLDEFQALASSALQMAYLDAEALLQAGLVLDATELQPAHWRLLFYQHRAGRHDRAQMSGIGIRTPGPTPAVTVELVSEDEALSILTHRSSEHPKYSTHSLYASSLFEEFLSTSSVADHSIRCALGIPGDYGIIL